MNNNKGFSYVIGVIVLASVSIALMSFSIKMNQNQAVFLKHFSEQNDELIKKRNEREKKFSEIKNSIKNGKSMNVLKSGMIPSKNILSYSSFEKIEPNTNLSEKVDLKKVKVVEITDIEDNSFIPETNNKLKKENIDGVYIDDKNLLLTRTGEDTYELYELDNKKYKPVNIITTNEDKFEIKNYEEK